MCNGIDFRPWAARPGLKSHRGDRGVRLTTHLNLEPRSRMTVTMTPSVCPHRVYRDKFYFLYY
jgi:hypothetical protein